MSENIVDRINAAKTKDDLEEIGKELEVDVDKRKGLETIRAGLLLQVDVDENGDDENPKAEAEQEAAKAKPPNQPEPVKTKATHEDQFKPQETTEQLAAQKGQAESSLNEAKTALDALEDIDEDATMYREIGELLVKTDYDDASESLEEKVDSLEVRVEQLEKREGRTREQFEELQEELQQMLQQGGGPMGPGGPGAGGA
jgi:prefoldin beta subunit